VWTRPAWATRVFTHARRGSYRKCGFFQANLNLGLSPGISRGWSFK
jgi:hypothetical protein